MILFIRECVVVVPNLSVVNSIRLELFCNSPLLFPFILPFQPFCIISSRWPYFVVINTKAYDVCHLGCHHAWLLQINKCNVIRRGDLRDIVLLRCYSWEPKDEEAYYHKNLEYAKLRDDFVLENYLAIILEFLHFLDLNSKKWKF